MEKDIHKWFSPPDPYANYNIARKTHQEGTAAWFVLGKEFEHWMSIGSLLWIHGKRKLFLHFAAQNLMASDLHTSGVWEEHPLVCHFQLSWSTSGTHNG
jgi:hypothetical protein